MILSMIARRPLEIGHEKSRSPIPARRETDSG